MKKKRVALVVPALTNGGGVSTTARFISRILSKVEDYDVSCISLATSAHDEASVRLLKPTTWFRGPEIHNKLWSHGVYQHVGCQWAEFEFQRYMPRRALTQVLNEYDLIQVVAGAPAAAYIARDVSKPVTLFIATLARLERKQTAQNVSLQRLIYRHIMQPIVSDIEKRALRKVAHVFAETEYAKQAILPYVERSRISTDTIGIDIERFYPVSEGNRADNYVLSVGRFSDARKNINLLFRAYALLRTSVPDAPRLLLAGASAPTPSSWDFACQLGVADYIDYQPNVSMGELVALYQNAMFFVLSSDEEGLGIVLLEAMACATPVISTRCGGPDSVISTEVGFLTPVGDANAMAERMLWMIQHVAERRKMGRAGRRMIEARFSSEVVGEKYLRVYHQLLNN